MRLREKYDPWTGEYYTVLENDEGGQDKVLSPGESWKLKKEIQEMEERDFKTEDQGGED